MLGGNEARECNSKPYPRMMPKELQNGDEEMVCQVTHKSSDNELHDDLPS